MNSTADVTQTVAGAPSAQPSGRRSPASTGVPLRHSLPAARVALLTAVVLALGAALDLIDPNVSVEGCVILLVLAAAFFTFQRSALGARLGAASVVSAQVAVLFLFLAYLAFRTAEFSAIVMLLYPAVMLAGVLRLDTPRLAWLAILAVLSHAFAIAVAVAGQPLINFAAISVHLGTLAAVMAVFVYSAGYINRLRTLLTEATRQLHDLRQTAADNARRDELTGAFNRGYLMEALAREIERAERVGKPLCVARVDIDNFRDINETFGHAAGDAVLARFTVATLGVARNVDIFGRIGATEFLLLMPDTSLPNAAIGAERLRAAIERVEVPELPGGARMTCTIGLSRHEPRETPAAVLGRAESGLNYARAAGRNRVMAIEAESAGA